MAKNVTLDSRVDKAKKIRNRTSKGLTFLLALGVFLFILTSSIAVPILWRGFYFSQAEKLQITEKTGYTDEQIRRAYHEMLDYCIGISSEFSVGELEFSVEGADHFKDCRGLFLLDLWVLAASTVFLLVWILIRKTVHMRACRLKGLGPAFWGSGALLALFGIIGGLGSIDFDKTFTIFHKLFFPGKSNWIFDPRIDQVIRILPEEFFMNCALLIVSLILGQCVLFMGTELILKGRR
ncbi:MAG: TIGR01906 family membrane protein [Lachnospiraceae bacterium]|nr:TIGR01906 family membrane protein [Lachnospiraceae bacterium]